MKQQPHQPLIVKARLGVIGDIHTQAERLTWALDLLRAQNVELIVATGDIADGPHDASAVARACKQLRQAGVACVLGNHDRWLLDNIQRNFAEATFRDELDPDTLAYLSALPATLDIETPRGLLLLGHGLGAEDMVSLNPHDHGPALTKNKTLQKLIEDARYSIVLSGHTHRRMVRTIDKITFVNAGSITAQNEPCCSLIDFSAGQVEFFDLATDGSTRPGPRFPL
jgi:putative phosphoesterase